MQGPAYAGTRQNSHADEIADYLNIRTEAVLEIIESWNAFNLQSFDRNAYEEDDIKLYETIGDVDSTYERIENKDFLEKSLDKFNAGEREFISLRYFKEKQKKLPTGWAFHKCMFQGWNVKSLSVSGGC